MVNLSVNCRVQEWRIFNAAQMWGSETKCGTCAGAHPRHDVIISGRHVCCGERLGELEKEALHVFPTLKELPQVGCMKNGNCDWGVAVDASAAALFE